MDIDVKLQWHTPDQHWVAVFVRDGEPWHLDGACVGFGMDGPAGAVDALLGVADHLVIEGENFLTGGQQISMDDREWLFSLLDQGSLADDDTRYLAMRHAREAAQQHPNINEREETR